jgi:hypothetical protein
MKAIFFTLLFKRNIFSLFSLKYFFGGKRGRVVVTAVYSNPFALPKTKDASTHVTISVHVGGILAYKSYFVFNSAHDTKVSLEKML